MLNRIVALILLIILSPVFLILGVLLLFFQGVPVFYIQKRVGLNMRLFSVFKFRSMSNGNITFVGKIIRNTGLDELPQLVNILNGEMSFIGPRPLTLDDVERLGWNSLYHSQRWKVRPGLSGLAQLSPVCNRRYSWFLDLYYAQNKTLTIDVNILLQSALVVFVGKRRLKNWKK